MPHSSLNLTRAREAFLYSIRRRSLRFAALVGVDSDRAQACLQQAVAAFLPESRTLQPALWAARWWALLQFHTTRFPQQLPIATPNHAEPWQQCWNQLSAPQRSAFLLRVWLMLPAGDTARALECEAGQSERHLAIASRQLRLTFGAEAQDARWLDRLRDAFDHLELGTAPTAPVAVARESAARSASTGHRRLAIALGAGLGCALVVLAVALWLPREEPLPDDLVVPEGATGLMRSNQGPSALPQDVTMLLDPDWPLWSSPEDGAVLRQLEFYAWLESENAD